MSRVANYYLSEIYKLAEKYGYNADFLIDKWNECGGDWEYFVGVTMERDW